MTSRPATPTMSTIGATTRIRAACTGGVCPTASLRQRGRGATVEDAPVGEPQQGLGQTQVQAADAPVPRRPAGTDQPVRAEAALELALGPTGLRRRPPAEHAVGPEPDQGLRCSDEARARG